MNLNPRDARMSSIMDLPIVVNRHLSLQQGLLLVLQLRNSCALRNVHEIIPAPLPPQFGSIIIPLLTLMSLGHRRQQLSVKSPSHRRY